MDISSCYDLEEIVNDVEAALLIDGRDYAEKDFARIISNIKNRIRGQYNVDLSKYKMNDESMYIGPQRQSAFLFCQNIADLHGRLAGYLQIVRYTHEVTVKLVNVNFLGLDEDKLMSILRLSQSKDHIPSVEQNYEIIKYHVCSINACMEKKLFIIMLVAHELGFYELLSCAAEILYVGGKV